MIKKIAALLLALSLCVSCTAYEMKEFNQQFSYQDPQTLGGTWTVSFDNGDTYHGATCSYWGTTDDTSVWTLPDGTRLIQSGNVHAVQE